MYEVNHSSILQETSNAYPSVYPLNFGGEIVKEMYFRTRISGEYSIQNHVAWTLVLCVSLTDAVLTSEEKTV